MCKTKNYPLYYYTLVYTTNTDDTCKIYIVGFRKRDNLGDSECEQQRQQGRKVR